MLAPVLLSTLVAAVLATVGLLVPAARVEEAATRRRPAAVAAGTALVSASGASATAVAGYAPGTVAVVTAVVAGASVAWLPVTRGWSARAHLAWAMDVALLAAYLVFMGAWVLGSALGASGQAGAFVLLALESFAALLATGYLWDLCDEVGRVHGDADAGACLTPEQAAGAQQPFVSLHVVAHDEDPETLIATLESLCDLYYSRFEVVVVDHNTADEALWRPVEAWCAAEGVRFAHLQDCPGYTAGALNHALRELTDPRAEVVGVIDPDYQVEPDFLLCCAPMLNDPAIGFVQGAQDFRRWRDVPFFRRLYHAHEHYFPVAQPSRHDRDGATFAGTMGLLRRAALDELGGWDEWCVTPEAELSLRLLRAGWSGRQVDTSFGHGLMPLSFEALKAQRFRRCFGAVQALRMHGASMLPRVGGSDNRLTPGRRWGLLSGAARWFGDLLALVMYFFLLAGAVDVALGGGLFRLLVPFLVAAVPVLGLVGLARAVAVVRRGSGATWSDVLGALFVSQATSLVVARASVRGLFARRAEFLRTPSTTAQPSLRDAVRCNKSETVLAVLGAGGIAVALLGAHSVSALLLALLLLLPTIGYASAVVNSLSARRAALPADLAARRRAELRRQHSVRPRVAGLAAIGAAAATSAVVVGLLGPGGRDVSVPDLRSRQEVTHDQQAPQEGGSPSPGVPTAPAPSPVR